MIKKVAVSAISPQFGGKYSPRCEWAMNKSSRFWRIYPHKLITISRNTRLLSLNFLTRLPETKNDTFWPPYSGSKIWTLDYLPVPKRMLWINAFTPSTSSVERPSVWWYWSTTPVPGVPFMPRLNMPPGMVWHPLTWSFRSFYLPSAMRCPL